MAQADRFLIPIRDHTPAAISVLDPVRRAHSEMIARLAALRPHRIPVSGANRSDLEGRAEYLREAFAAFHTSIKAVVADTLENVSIGSFDRAGIDAILSDLPDLSADLASEIAAAGDCWAEENGQFGMGA